MAKSRIKESYMLMPYGSLTNTGHRFVAEMIQNQDGDEILGTPGPSDHMISMIDVGMTAKISKQSNGVYITDLKFLDKTEPRGEKVLVDNAKVMKALLEKGMLPKPQFTGTVNKKLGIVMDCKVVGFYIGPSTSHLKKSPLG